MTWKLSSRRRKWAQGFEEERVDGKGWGPGWVNLDTLISKARPDTTPTHPHSPTLLQAPVEVSLPGCHRCYKTSFAFHSYSFWPMSHVMTPSQWRVFTLGTGGIYRHSMSMRVFLIRWERWTRGVNKKGWGEVRFFVWTCKLIVALFGGLYGCCCFLGFFSAY
jgi:hypothetical protein